MVAISEQRRYERAHVQEQGVDVTETLPRSLSGGAASPDCESGLPRLSAVDVDHFIRARDRLDDPATTPLLRRLVEDSARPLATVETHFAADGIVFGQDGATLRPWGVQCHLACGVDTGIVAAVEVGSPGARSGRFLSGLLRTVRSNFPGARELSAGQAYLSRENFETAARLGMALYVPFRTGSAFSGSGQRSPAWDAALRLYRHRHGEFVRHHRLYAVIENVLDGLQARTSGYAHAGTGTAQLNATLIEALDRNVRVVAALRAAA